MKVEMTRFAFEGTEEEFKNVKRTFTTLGKTAASNIPYQQLTQDNLVQDNPVQETAQDKPVQEKPKPAKKGKAKKTEVIEQVPEVVEQEDDWDIAE